MLYVACCSYIPLLTMVHRTIEKMWTLWDWTLWIFTLTIFTHRNDTKSNMTKKKLNSNIPSGDVSEKWTKHKFEMKLVNPANKRKIKITNVESACQSA